MAKCSASYPRWAALESAGLWGLWVKVPFRLAPWSSVQCVFKLPPHCARLPESVPALGEVCCGECLLAGLSAGLLGGEQGNLVCSPEPQWTGRAIPGVWCGGEKEYHTLCFLSLPFHLRVKAHHLALY